MLAALKGAADAGVVAEAEGDTATAFATATQVVEAEYAAPYLAHAQLEPPSATARFNGDGTLDLWLPNQMPELFQAVAAEIAGMQPGSVRIHSPMLGGFFGRHFRARSRQPVPASDPARQGDGTAGQGVVVARGGVPQRRVAAAELQPFPRRARRRRAAHRARGPHRRRGPDRPLFRRHDREVPVDSSAVEGIVEKPYAIANRRVTFTKLPHPVTIAFWRSVGHSMNDCFYESFLDEVALAGEQDPFALRLALLQNKPRQRRLLEVVADLSGGWKRGPYDAPGGPRARGVSMASPFGSETATIAEVSVSGGEARVHNLWIAFDPGSIVNPAIIKAQVKSAAALGLSSVLFEQVVYKDGLRQVAELRYLPDPAPRAHAGGPGADRRKRRADGRRRRTRPARRPARGDQRDRGRNWPAHPLAAGGGNQASGRLMA